MKKVFIVGSNGLIGWTICNYLKDEKKIDLFCGLRKKNKHFNKYKIFEYNNLVKKKCIKNLNNFIIKIKPDFVINCAGVTKHVNKKKNIEINYSLPLTLSKLSKKFKFSFIHISTDCVFSGKEGNYKETSLSDAKDNYGKIKSLIEKKLKNNKNTIILRTSTLGMEMNKKFGLLEWFLSKNKSVYGYKNVYFSGPTAPELSKIIYEFIIKKSIIKRGIYNISSYKISKFDLLKLIKKVYNKKTNIIPSYEIKIDRSLNNKKFLAKTNYIQKNWVTLLKEMKKFYEKKYI